MCVCVWEEVVETPATLIYHYSCTIQYSDSFITGSPIVCISSLAISNHLNFPQLLNKRFRQTGRRQTTDHVAACVCACTYLQVCVRECESACIPQQSRTQRGRATSHQATLLADAKRRPMKLACVVRMHSAVAYRSAQRVGQYTTHVRLKTVLLM